MINKIFESGRYSGIMMFIITFVVLLILFNFVIILNDADEVRIIKTEIKGVKVSGMAVNEIEKVDKVIVKNDSITFRENQVIEELIYSEQSYAFYYFILMIIGFMIVVLAIILILPRVRDYT